MYNASNGNASSIGDICSAKGGYICSAAMGTDGGNGGSGGGGGNYYYSNASFVTDISATQGALGGKDGGNGQSTSFGGVTNNGGTGQGTTTRYFGESNGTLYSTGGCGYNAKNGWYNTSAPGDGGSGGGNTI